MPYDLPRIPLPTSASSADLARLPATIRQQALFSARLGLAEPVAQIGVQIKGLLDGTRSESEARRDIRASLAAAGYRPPEGAEGGLRDHTSRTRLDLILQTNVRAARGYAHRAAGMDPDTLWAMPAQELVRVMSRKNPRGDWKARWEAAGGTLRKGRMVALKTSPIWASLSRFGNPYPPFDFGSGMGLIDLSRDEAVRLGLLGENDTLTPDPVPFPEVSEANLPNVDAVPDLQAAILKVFGEGARFEGGVLSLAPARELPASGNAAALGLPPLADATVAASLPRIPPGEAWRLMRTKQSAVKDAQGTIVRFEPDVVTHWEYKPAERDRRLMRIREAMEAVREPQEVWSREGKRFYFKTFMEEDGKPRRMMVVVRDDGSVVTWIPTDRSPRYADQRRSGALLAKEGA
jgi:hypothetical protein